MCMLKRFLLCLTILASCEGRKTSSSSGSQKTAANPQWNSFVQNATLVTINEDQYYFQRNAPCTYPDTKFSVSGFCVLTLSSANVTKQTADHTAPCLTTQTAIKLFTKWDYKTDYCCNGGGYVCHKSASIFWLFIIIGAVAFFILLTIMFLYLRHKKRKQAMNSAMVAAPVQYPTPCQQQQFGYGPQHGQMGLQGPQQGQMG